MDQPPALDPPRPASVPEGGAEAWSPAAAHSLLSDQGGVYRTAPRRVGWLARTFPSMVFFLKFTRIVFQASRMARRGRYLGLQWSLSSLDVLRALESVGVQFEISGIEHLQRLDRPCVVAGNHMSTLETATLPAVIQPIREVTFVVKKSLIDYPVFKHVMRSRNPIAISQTNAREDFRTVMEEGVDRLARGVSVVVFPEASRVTAFKPEQFNTIGVKLAARAGAPIVPLALVTDAWPVGKWISDVARLDPSKKVRMAFGEPIVVDGRGTEAHQQVVAFIRSRLDAWQSEDSLRGRA